MGSAWEHQQIVDTSLRSPGFAAAYAPVTIFSAVRSSRCERREGQVYSYPTGENNIGANDDNIISAHRHHLSRLESISDTTTDAEGLS